VKVGADTGVERVQLTPVITSNVVDLNALFEPERPPQHDNDTRLDEEVHVYEIHGRLVKFKREGGTKGDRDYHLVVSDDTRTFTASNGEKSGHSVVSEIVDPECIAGMRGDPEIPSRFIEQIKQSRRALEEKFADIPDGAWVNAHGVKVRIVGIGFFDRAHGQVGRSLNNLELHPVLEIAFEGATTPTSTPIPTPTPAPTSTPEGLLRNSGFEDGRTAWNAPADVINKNSAIPAHGGSWKAWMCGYGESHGDTLYQLVTIPSSSQLVSLKFFLSIDTEEGPNKAYDTLKLQIRDASGQWLKTPRSWSNLDSTQGFVQQTVNLSSFRGKTVRINFECREDSRTVTNFVLDDVQLEANQ
jgi:hypothetical protein